MEEAIVKDVPYIKYERGAFTQGSISIPKEVPFVLYVNGEELVTIQCTPIKTNCLVLGFLYLEGIIKGVEDVLVLRVCEEEGVVDVRIKNTDFKPPEKRTLTTGCGGGSVFDTEVRKTESKKKIGQADVLNLMREFNKKVELFKISGGVHASALAEDGKILVMSEDVGRHNTVDKIMGECLLTGIDPREKVLITTGRISSEMVIKASRMGVPIVVSRHSATGRAFALAKEAEISLICHATSYRYSVLTCPERILRET